MVLNNLSQLEEKGRAVWNYRQLLDSEGFSVSPLEGEVLHSRTEVTSRSIRGTTHVRASALRGRGRVRALRHRFPKAAL